MKKTIYISLFLMSVFCLFSAKNYALDPYLEESKKFIDSFEWDSKAFQKVSSFKKYEENFLRGLSSTDVNDIYISLVMLGLIKSDKSISSIAQIKSKTTIVKIGISFAYCMLNYNYEKNIQDLMKIGKSIQNAGGALSLKYLEVVQLLSFLDDKRFIDYAKSLTTDEVYQQEAISIAMERYQYINLK